MKSIENLDVGYYPSYRLHGSGSGSGSVKVKKTGGYSIYTYDNDTICFDAPIEIRQYRSVIFDEYGLVSFSPPRSIHYSNMSKTDSNHLYINEAIEGIMIHLFYSKSNNSWQIATKNSIGGNRMIWNKTVLKMMMDVFGQDSNINNVPEIQQLYRNYSYTLVLQHPDNLILLPIKNPALYVCAVYDISIDRAIYIPPHVYEEWECFENTPFTFPKHLNMNMNMNEAKKYVESPELNVLCMGFMVTNLITGDRCKLINPDYTDMLGFRKLNTLQQYQYLCLYRIDRINEYVLYFPKQKTACMHFSKQYRNFAKGLHESYLERFVKKTKIQTKTKYTELTERLHREIYLPSFRKGKGTRQMINLDIVREYMKGMNPVDIMYYLNHDQRLLCNG